MANTWIETSKQTTYQARPGQDLITVTLEFLSPQEQTYTFPTGAFNKESSFQEGRNTAKYSLYAGTQAAAYVVRGSMSTEPLATHPMFSKTGKFPITEAEWKKYKKWQTDPASTTWRPDGSDASDQFKKYWKLIEQGIDSFLNGTVEMQVTEIVTQKPSIRSLGKIDAPTNAPTLPNGRTWMIIGVDAEQVGDQWRQVTSYRASMDGGWNEEIYKY